MMSQAVSIVVLLALALVCEISAQAPPLLFFEWKNPESGLWHDKDNWVPRGIPRSGNHRALFNHVDFPRYTITHDEPILVGEVVVMDSAELIFNSTIGVLIDSEAIAQPIIETTGQTLGFPIMVMVEDLSLAFGDVEVVLTNIRTGDMETITLVSDQEVGEFFGSFSTVCDEDPISEPDDGVLNALPFDIITLNYLNSTATGEVVLAFMEPYQERLEWPVVSTTLMSYATQKAVRKLHHLKHKLMYVLDNLPPYETNDCCPNEEYRYPLDLTGFAERSYQFYTGNIFGPVGCEDFLAYCARLELYRDNFGVTEMEMQNRSIRTFHWTGAGLSYNWDDAKNWSPRGIPDSESDSVHFSTDATVFLNRNIDIGQVNLGGFLEVYQGEHQLSVGGSPYVSEPLQLEELDGDLLSALEEKISIKTILQALFGEKLSA